MNINRIITPTILAGMAALGAAQRTEFDFIVVRDRVYTVATRHQGIYADTELRCKNAVERVNFEHDRVLSEIDDLVAKHIVTKEEDINWLRDTAKDEWSKQLDLAYEERDTWVQANLEYVPSPPPEFREELVIVEIDVIRHEYRPNHRVWFECESRRGGKWNISHVEYKRPFEGYKVAEGPHGVRYGEKIAYDKKHVTLVHNDFQKVSKPSYGAPAGLGRNNSPSKPTAKTEPHGGPTNELPKTQNSRERPKHEDPKNAGSPTPITGNSVPSKTPEHGSGTPIHERPKHEDPKPTGSPTQPSGTPKSHERSKTEEPKGSGSPAGRPESTRPPVTNHERPKSEEPKGQGTRTRPPTSPDSTPKKSSGSSNDRDKDKDKGKGKKNGG